MKYTPRARHCVAACITTLAAILAQPLSALAHGPFHEQLAEINLLLTQFPDSAALYLQRGELYRYHADWREALADYAYAEKLNPQLNNVDWCRGQLLLEAGQLVPAKKVLDRLLLKIPQHGDGYLTRARVLKKLGKPLAAAEDFTRALKYLIVLQPDYYLERAQVLASAGDQYISTALRGLDEGMQELGPLVTLQLYAIDLEIQQKNYNAALQRLDPIIAQSPRKESWLLRRGEIQQLAGRRVEAVATYKMALREIEALPPERRQVQTTAELEKHLRNALQEESLNMTKAQ